MFAYILAVVYIAALFALLVVSRRKKTFYAAMKGVCSALFLVCVIASWCSGQKLEEFSFWLLLAALVLCAFGDVFLGVANNTSGRVSKKPFLAGAASFTIAHVLFCCMFYYRGTFYWFDVVLPLALMGILFALEKKDRVRLKKMRLMGFIYTFMVGLMAGKALQLVIVSGAVTTGEILLAVGAALFLASDILLLFLYFGTVRYTWIRAVNLTSYYIGVFLMASAAYWL